MNELFLQELAKVFKKGDAILSKLPFPETKKPAHAKNFGDYWDVILKAIDAGACSEKTRLDLCELALEEYPGNKVFQETRIFLKGQTDQAAPAEMNPEPPAHEEPILADISPSTSVVLFTCPDKLARFWNEIHDGWWDRASKEAREILSGLTPKLEPICKEPGESKSPPWGFELLGCDLKRRAFGALLAVGKPHGISPEILAISLMIVQLNTIAPLKGLFHERHDVYAERLYWTLNVDRAMLDSDFFEPALDRYLTDNTCTLFEAHENLSVDHAKKLLEIGETYSCGHGLDDGNDMKTDTRMKLRPTAVFAKVDYHTTTTLLKNWERGVGKEVLDELKKYRLNGKPYIIEGVESQNVRKLKRHIHADENIFFQGHGVKLAGDWEVGLVKLEPGGYLVRG